MSLINEAEAGSWCGAAAFHPNPANELTTEVYSAAQREQLFTEEGHVDQ